MSPFLFIRLISEYPLVHRRPRYQEDGQEVPGVLVAHEGDRGD